MRYTQELWDNWQFKLTDEIPHHMPNSKGWQSVVIPHTWNGIDGQDGGGDYYRGKGVYVRKLIRPDVPEDYKIYIEFEGVNSVAEVYANGEKLDEHRGGYSTFRVDITDQLKNGQTTLAVVADNSHFDDVYPQVADFTFYGGIYRNVNLVAVPRTHFDLIYHGSQGLTYQTQIKNNGELAHITMRAWIYKPEPTDHVQFEIMDREGETVEVYTLAEEVTDVETTLYRPHLWQGVEDPYLYTLTARIWRGNECLDEVSTNLGIREFHVDPEKGFFLNGKAMPLRGVAKHQDRIMDGNALRYLDLYEDFDIIQDIGANTVRLAHYQHSQDVYDICDEFGFIVWAEIPFISVFNDNLGAQENTIAQMSELIYQSYNHPSICFWGIGNELLIGEDSPELVQNLKDLETLVKDIDPSRLTTIAQFSSTPAESVHNQITDLVAYNHYFGWYVGDVTQNEAWLDKFHADYPNTPIGLSEYGAEGIINWHSNEPKMGDYTEEYQALYHEHMVKVLDERPYIWASHVWNMFDFGADNRDEGGVKGRNNKGLVTFDRRIKKDAFYIYKAYWSDHPFVHITGRRYAKRPYEKMDVKVYSNLSEVTLYVDGEKHETLTGDKIFIFRDVPLKDGFTAMTAIGKSFYDVDDTVTFEKVEEPTHAYHAPLQEDKPVNVINWFEEASEGEIELTFDENYFSVKDTVKDLFEHEDARQVLKEGFAAISGIHVKPATLQMFNDVPLEKIANQFLGGDKEAPGYKLLNQKLQKIKKTE